MLLFLLVIIPILLHVSVWADQVSITALPLYSEASDDDQLCVYSGYTSYITSYGCQLNDPANCLCTEASKSYKVASAISNCAYGVAQTVSTASTATQIWASYCLTNAGVSARDQTLLQDFALFTQATFDIGYCATSVTSRYSRSYGCDFLTPAACLCATSQSSSAIESAISSCASDAVVSDIQISTIGELWGSYCKNNTATTATRVIGAVITPSASTDAAAASSAASSAAPSSIATFQTSRPTASSVARTQSSSPTSSSTSSSTSSPTSSNSQSSSGGGLSVGAQVGLAIGCAFGAALLTILATWYRPNQMGRILTCGIWPRKKTTIEARQEMQHLVTGLFGRETPRAPAVH